MAVYVIQAGDDGPVKIGYTSGPAEKRLRGLQTGNPYKLRILKVFDGDERHESELHRRFAGHRIRGEWFDPCVIESMPDHKNGIVAVGPFITGRGTEHDFAFDPRDGSVWCPSNLTDVPTLVLASLTKTMICEDRVFVPIEWMIDSFPSIAGDLLRIRQHVVNSGSALVGGNS